MKVLIFIRDYVNNEDGYDIIMLNIEVWLFRLQNRLQLQFFSLAAIASHFQKKGLPEGGGCSPVSGFSDVDTNGSFASSRYYWRCGDLAVFG
jgi:hypothetical protein